MVPRMETPFAWRGTDRLRPAWAWLQEPPERRMGGRGMGRAYEPQPTAAYRTMSLPRGSKRSGKWVASSPHTGGVRGWGTCWGTSLLGAYRQVIEIYEKFHIAV